MTAAAVIMLTLIAVLWTIAPWIRRRNARQADAHETTWLHSHDRPDTEGEP